MSDDTDRREWLPRPPDGCAWRGGEFGSLALRVICGAYRDAVGRPAYGGRLIALLNEIRGLQAAPEQEKHG
jgi:hypothetical protein